MFLFSFFFHNFVANDVRITRLNIYTNRKNLTVVFESNEILHRRILLWLKGIREFWMRTKVLHIHKNLTEKVIVISILPVLGKSSRPTFFMNRSLKEKFTTLLYLYLKPSSTSNVLITRKW